MPFNETLGIEFQFDTDNLQRGTNEAKKYLSDLRKEQKANTTAYGEWQKSIKGVETYLQYQNKALDVNAKRVEALAAALEKEKSKSNASAVEIQRITNMLNDAQIAYNQTSNNISIYTKRLEELKQEAAAADASNSSMVNNLSRGAQIMSTALGTLAGRFGYEAVSKVAGAAVDGAKASVAAAIEYESAMAKVVKTVDATQAEIDALSESLKGLSAQIPHTAAELAEVAALGGQLGISTEGLLEFTKTMVLLGDSTNLTAEQAGELLAKFANVTKTAEADFGRLGSVIVALGNNTATTESDIVEMGQRLSAAGTAAGFSADQILAISAALSSLGIESEAGASSISKLINRFQVATATGEGLTEIAETAGTSAEEFSRIFSTDAAEALRLFIEGLSGADNQVAVLQKTLGITEVRLTNTLQAMASNTSLLGDTLDIASKAWEDNTALTREASIFYDTTASKIERAKSALKSFGETVGKYAAPLIGSAADAIVALLSPLDASKTAIDEAGAKLSEYGATAKSTAGNIDEVTTAQRALNAVLMLDTVQSLADKYSDASKQWKKYSRQVESTGAVHNDYMAGILATARANGIMVNSLEELNEAIAKQPEIVNFKSYGVDPTDPFLSGTIRDRMNAAAKEMEKYNDAVSKAEGYTRNMADAVNYVAEAIVDGMISDTQLSIIENEEFVKAVNDRAKAIKHAQELEAVSAKVAADEYEKQVQSAKTLRDTIMASNFVLETRRGMLEDLLNTEKANRDALDDSSQGYREAEGRIAVYSAALEDVDAQLAATREKYDEVNTSLTALTGTQGAANTSTMDQIATAEARLDALKAEKDAYTENSMAADEYRAALDRMIAAEADALEALKKSYTKDLQGKVADIQKGFIQKYGTEEEKSLQKLQGIVDEFSSITDTIKEISAAVDADILSPEEGKNLADTLSEIQDGLKGVAESMINEAPDPAEWKLTIDTISNALSDLNSVSTSFINQFADSMLKAAEAFGTLSEMADEKVTARVATFLSGMSELGTGALGIYTDYWNDQLENIEDKTDEITEQAQRATESAATKNKLQLSDLDQQYSEGALSYAEYMDKKKKADEEYAAALEQIERDKTQAEKDAAEEKNELARKAFEANKANQIASVVMNSAVAILKAWADLGPLAASAATVAIGALAGIQTAQIAQQQFVPMYAKGGVFDSPHIGIIGEDGAEVVMPLEKNTGWIDVLAQKLNKAQAATNNSYTTSNDSHAVTVNQQIYARPQSKREIYLQTRAAISAARR